MLLSRPLAFAAVTLALLAPLAAQNALQHIDGTGFTSRGTNGTAADGISLQCEIGALNTALAMNPLAIGYTGAAGVAGLAFESTAGGPAVLSTGNRSWALCARFVDDTLQPFVDRPGVPSLTQQFGYVALFPDLARSDRIGWQAHATASIGDLAGLLVGTPTGGAAPAPLPVTAGLLCLNPTLPLITVGIAFYAPIPGGSGLAANWGSFPVSPVFAGAVLFAQAVSLKANGSIALTTSCRTQL